MRRLRLFSSLLASGSVTLPPQESHHAITVLRSKPGQEVILFDGAGREGCGRVVSVDRKRLVVELNSVVTRPFELSHRITLAVAMARIHRQGYLIEKCTELGVAGIWPILAKRSVSKPDRKSAEKLTRRSIEAAKQAGRAWVPELSAPQGFSQAVERIREFHASSLTVTGPAAMPFDRFLAGLDEGGKVLVWVGPEGGWTDDERDRLLAAGAIDTTLGPTVLRTETAALAACAAASLQSLSRGADSPTP